jgi:hypothetical protein
VRAVPCPPACVVSGDLRDDAEGTLLLAVVPLPALEEVEDDGAQHLSVTLEGGQTVALAMMLGKRTGGEERA